MANTKKRVLSLLMALVMTLGLFPVSALAASGNSADQISNHYAPTVEGEDVTWTESNTDTVTDETNGVTVQKKIDGTDQENVFDITLNVTTKEQLANLAVSPDAAVVVVLDVSGSMNDTLDGEVKLTQAKAAAKEFVTSLAEGAEGARRMVSVVQFDTDAIAVQPWINAVGADDSINSTIEREVTPKFKYHECQISGKHTHEESYIKAAVRDDWVYSGLGIGYTCTVCGRNPLAVHDHCTFTGCTQKIDTKHKHTVSYSGPHGEMKTSGNSTNIEAGLQLASNLLTQLSGLDGCAKIDKRYVVLLSDGAPNRIIARSADRTSTTFIKGTEGEKDKTLAAAVATQIRATKGNAATLYAISYAEHKKDALNSNAKWLRDNIASPNGFFDAASNETLDLAFEKINEQIKLLAQAWTVDDPMGEDVSFVQFNNGTGTSDEVRKLDGSTIHWDLKRDTPEHIGDTYTYSLSYRVKLNTDKMDFNEDIDHRTNGLTTLKYVVTENGVVPENPEVLQLHFNVPSVTGTVPMLNYSIEYYWQQGADVGVFANYTKHAGLENLSAKMHTEVSVIDKDADYKTKYDKDNYHWVKSDPETATLTQDGTILKVYYNHDMVNIGVEHWLKTDTYTADGVFTEGVYVSLPESSNEISVPKGGDYEATKLSDDATKNYTFVEGDPTSASLTNIQGGEVIKLYYKTVEDARENTTVAVYHQIDHMVWELVADGNGDTHYELTRNVGTPSLKKTDENVKAYAPYTESAALEGVTFESAKLEQSGSTTDLQATDGSVQFTTAPNGNKLTLVFVSEPATPPVDTEATIQVTHKYTKDVTTIVDGTAVRDQKAHADIVECYPVSGTWYPGETHTVTANQATPAGGTDTYQLPTEASKQVRLVPGQNDVTFEYTLTSAPAETTATIKYVYRTLHKITNPETGETIQEEDMSKHVENAESVNDLLVGQYVPIQKDSNLPTGNYQLVEKDPEDYQKVPAAENGTTVITLTYELQDVVDDRTEATVNVTHSYFVNMETVENGTAVTVKRPEGVEDNTVVTGKVGDLMFPAGEEGLLKLEHNGHTYTRSDNSSLEGNFKLSNPDIGLTYIRNDSDRVETGYQVNYTYYDWQMTVKDGVAGYYDDASKVKNNISTSEDVKSTSEKPLYVGMNITLADGKMTGYKAQDDNSDTAQLLKATPEGGENPNVYNFTFVKRTPLAPATVTVKHSYVLTTISEIGESATATPVEKPGTATPDSTLLHKDVAVSTVAVKDGYTLISVTGTNATGEAVTYTADEDGKVSFLATGADTVVFNYTKTDDLSADNKAHYTINHYYRVLDWNDTESKAYDAPITTAYGDSFGGVHQSGSVDLKLVDGKPTYTLTDITWTGCDTPVYNGKTCTMQLKPGENTLNFYYTKTEDTRPEVPVTVNHIYRVTDSNAPGGFVQEAVVSESKQVKAPSQYTAEQELTRTVSSTEGDKTIEYTFVSSDPTDGKLHVIFEGNNVINLYYTRNYGEGEGFAVSGTKTYVGLNPDQYPVTTVYLSQNGEQKYSETVINGHFGFANVVPGVYDISESAAVSGYTYTAQYMLTAHTANAPQLRALQQGTVDITANPQITVVGATEYLLEITNTYTQTSTPPPTEPIIPPVEPDNDPDEGYGPGENPLENIVTPEVPLADLPETEIPLTELPETEVPLAEAPATGDNLAMWIMAAAISGLSLVWLMISGKKHKDENAE